MDTASPQQLAQKPAPRRRKGLSNAQKLAIVLVITSVYFLVELIVGYMTGMLSLVSDSFQMFQDALSLATALYVIRASSKDAASLQPRHTYGYRRAEVLGAFANGVVLLTLCLGVYISAIQRLFNPEEVRNPKVVVTVGSIGLVLNIIGLLIFRDHATVNVSAADEIGSEAVDTKAADEEKTSDAVEMMDVSSAENQKHTASAISRQQQQQQQQQYDEMVDVGFSHIAQRSVSLRGQQQSPLSFSTSDIHSNLPRRSKSLRPPSPLPSVTRIAPEPESNTALLSQINEQQQQQRYGNARRQSTALSRRPSILSLLPDMRIDMPHPLYRQHAIIDAGDTQRRRNSSELDRRSSIGSSSVPASPVPPSHRVSFDDTRGARRAPSMMHPHPHHHLATPQIIVDPGRTRLSSKSCYDRSSSSGQRRTSMDDRRTHLSVDVGRPYPFTRTPSPLSMMMPPINSSDEVSIPVNDITFPPLPVPAVKESEATSAAVAAVTTASSEKIPFETSHDELDHDINRSSSHGTILNLDDDSNAQSATATQSSSNPQQQRQSQSQKNGHMNMHSAFLHILSDAMSSVAVLASSIFIWKTNFSWRLYVDPITAILINTMIVYFTIPLMRSTTYIMLQSAPDTIPIDELKEELESVDGVHSVHDLHIWQLSDLEVVASVHVVIIEKPVEEPAPRQQPQQQQQPGQEMVVTATGRALVTADPDRISLCPSSRSFMLQQQQQQQPEMPESTQQTTAAATTTATRRYHSAKRYMKIARRINALMHEYGISSATIQPEFVRLAPHPSTSTFSSRSNTLSSDTANQLLHLQQWQQSEDVPVSNGIPPPHPECLLVCGHSAQAATARVRTYAMAASAATASTAATGRRSVSSENDNDNDNDNEHERNILVPTIHIVEISDDESVDDHHSVH